MVHCRLKTVVLCLAATMLLAAPSSAFALAGLMTSPGVSIRKGGPLDAKAVRKVIANKKYQFVSGYFFNQFSTLYYSGDVSDLNAFLIGLSKLKGAKVSLKYSKQRGVADTTWFGKAGKKVPCQWMLSHNGAANFGVTVYLGDGKIDKEDVDVPPEVTTSK